MKKNEVRIIGLGLHSGDLSVMTATPAASGGIVFVRGGREVPALYGNVSETKYRSTTIGRGKHTIKTIEHLMASLFALRITDVKIAIASAETPILDGGATQFMNELKSLGGKGGFRTYLRVKRPVIAHATEVVKELPFFQRWPLRISNYIKGWKLDGYVRLVPTTKKELRISARIRRNEPVVGDQKYEFVFDYDNFAGSAAAFAKDVAKARTFGTLAEWAWLKKHGMGRGCNEHNVLVLDETGKGTLNERYYADEFVRHKIIDTAGDLYTSGYPVIGRIESFRGSHAMNNLVLKKLFADPKNYDIIA